MTAGGTPSAPNPRIVLAGVRRDLARVPAVLAALLADPEDALWRARPAPAEWSPVEIVCTRQDGGGRREGAPAEPRARSRTAFAEPGQRLPAIRVALEFVVSRPPTGERVCYMN